MWITADDVKMTVGLTPADTFDAAWCTQVADAVNALAVRLRPDLTPAFDPEAYSAAFDTTTGPAADMRQGCLEMAARMYRARGGTDDTGDALYVYPARYLDANIRLLWGLDRPVIA